MFKLAPQLRVIELTTYLEWRDTLSPKANKEIDTMLQFTGAYHLLVR